MRYGGSVKEEPKEITIRYWPKNKPIPEGWTTHEGLNGTHHGTYSVLLVKKSA